MLLPTKPCCCKVEEDIKKADKKAKRQQRQLENMAATKKAEDMATIDGEEGGGNTTDNGSDDGSREGGVNNIVEDLTKRSPEDAFARFDTDGSGLIDFDEFRAMLPHLGIKISMPKVTARGVQWRRLLHCTVSP